MMPRFWPLCDIGDITIFCHFYLYDSPFVYRPGPSLSVARLVNREVRYGSAIAKTPVDKYARNLSTKKRQKR